MGQLGGEASIELDRPIDEVYAFLEDTETAASWQGGLEDIEVLERDAEGRPTLCETTSDAKVKTVKSKIRFSYDPPNAVRWTQVKGDLKSVDGFWELTDLGGGRTKVVYSMVGDPGRMLGMAIRGPVEGKLKDMLVAARPGELKAALGA